LAAISSEVKPKLCQPAIRRTVTPVPAMHGRPLRISADFSISVPISTAVGILCSTDLSIDSLASRRESSALRWLYVSTGPLAGKRFILYKPVTTIGSDQSCHIYLFTDPTVLPRHAVIEMCGPRALLRAAGPLQVKGRSA